MVMLSEVGFYKIINGLYCEVRNDKWHFIRSINNTHIHSNIQYQFIMYHILSYYSTKYRLPIIT